MNKGADRSGLRPSHIELTIFAGQSGVTSVVDSVMASVAAKATADVVALGAHAVAFVRQVVEYRGFPVVIADTGNL